MNDIQITGKDVEKDQLTEKIIGAAIEVHRNLGPGLLESVYEECLAHEMRFKNLKIVRQLELPIIYKGLRLRGDYRIDLLVNDEVLIEIKSVTQLTSVHEAQILTYLKLRGGGRGLLINFNVAVLKDGVRRFRT